MIRRHALARPITPDEVHSFQKAGVALLKGVLDLATVNELRRNIDTAVATLGNSPSGYDMTALTQAYEHADDAALRAQDGRQYEVSEVVKHMKTCGKPLLVDQAENGEGHFFIDSAVTNRIRDLRRFALKGAAAEISGALLRSKTVRFFGDQIFVKEPGTKQRTAFHQDASYFEIDGHDCCVLWIPVDPVTAETGGMLYIRGSHLEEKLYQPNVFVTQASLPGSEGPQLPDIEGNLDDYDIIGFNVEPGDVVVHHFKTIHGARGNTSRYQVRRAISIRYTGDDIRAVERPWTPKQLHLTRPLSYGQPLDGPDFPVVWQRQEEGEAA